MKIKRYILLVILIILAWSDTYSFDFKVGHICYNITSDKEPYTVEVTKGFAYVDVVIPETVIYDDIEYTVTAIGNNAFENLDLTLTSVIMPNSITKIGSYAFWCCRGLIEIEMSDSIKTIGDHAFYLCQNLRNIKLPKALTSIETEAFACCSKLRDLEFNNSLQTLESAAFGYCKELTSIEIPMSVHKIAEGAFAGCLNLKNISVSEDNPVYDSRNNCNAIIETATNTLISGCQTTVIPKGITKIGNYAFTEHKNLTEIQLPNTIREYGNSVFRHCEKLMNVEFSNSTDTITIGDGLFYGCYNLKKVTFPEGVTRIGNSMFSYCPLEEITFEENLAEIGQGCFDRCIGNTIIYLKAQIPPKITSESFDSYTYDFFPTIYVPKESFDLYTNSRWIKGDKFLQYYTIRSCDYSNIEEVPIKRETISVNSTQINISGIEPDSKVEIFDLYGRSVYSGYDTTIDLNSTGMFIVRINGQSTKVLLK